MAGKLWALAFLLALPLLSADGAYRLRPLPDGPCREGDDCIPIILIHGIHGSNVHGPCGLDADPGADCKWAPLLDHLERHYPSVWPRLQVYIFRYLSDRGDSVIEMGRQLRFLVERERASWRSPAVIVAKSMGGLVARAFIAGQPHPLLLPGHRLVKTAITLATPHHGTPLANRVLRNRLAEEITGVPVTNFNLYDNFYWSWNASPHLTTNPDEPNRSDLLWDDYDGLFADLRRQAGLGSIETNHSLRQLDPALPIGVNLIVYGGYLAPASSRNATPPTGSGSPPPPAGDTAGQLLRFAGRLLSQQLDVVWNDGFVPLDSAMFAGNPGVSTRRVFPGYDHRDMMGAHSRVVGDRDLRTALLERLALDIARAAGMPSRSSRTAASRTVPVTGSR